MDWRSSSGFPEDVSIKYHHSTIDRQIYIMKNSLKFILAFVALIFCYQAMAQKKAISQPKSCKRPIDSNTGWEQQEDKDRIRAPWIVICDRDNAKTYKDSKGRPNKNAEFKTLKFKDWFYVWDEQDDWIRIFKGKVSPSNLKVSGTAEDFGWIKKSDILLWNTGLIDSKTQINLKAFLLNKANEVKNILALEKKEVVPIFKGPKTGEKIGQKTIYEFYFVFKKEHNRYLISKNVNINPQHNIEDLVGWVRVDRAETWNTRICLEPNFKDDAFEERKNHIPYRFVAYGKETNARIHATNGSITREDVIWANDPVGLNQEQLATDGKRFKGAVVRFPMLSNRSGSSFYRSGVIGEINVKTFGELLDTINEINYSSILSSISNQENSRDNFNVLFVMEGTQSMSKYKNAVTNTLQKIQTELSNVPSVKYGAAIYRDEPEKQFNRLFEVYPVNPDPEGVVSFIENAEFRRWADNDSYTSMRYGINQAMIESGLNSNHTNIVFLIANSADYFAARERRVAAQANNDETYLEVEEIVDKLANVSAHFISIQCRHSNDRESVYFVKQSRDLMLESAKKQFDLYKGVTDYVRDITLVTPEIPEGESQLEQKLVGGAGVGFLKKPSSGTSLDEEEVTNFIVSSVRDVYYFVDEFWDNISKIADDGAPINKISAGEFAPAAAKMLMKLLEKDSRAYSRDDIVKLTRDKYKLYTEVYFPKQISGANYPTTSQVLFMPKDDLENYITVLDALGFALTKPMDEVRMELYNALRSLIKQFTGNDFVKGYSTQDLWALMQGVTKEGLQSSNERDFFLIEDVRSSKKVSDEEVRNFAHRMASKAKNLKRINTRGKDHEFSYVSEGNIYFWIPIDMTF